jgi:hypothetical protein
LVPKGCVEIFSFVIIWLGLKTPSTAPDMDGVDADLEVLRQFPGGQESPLPEAFIAAFEAVRAA